MAQIKTLENEGPGSEAVYQTVQSDEMLFIPESYQKVLIERGVVFFTTFKPQGRPGGRRHHRRPHHRAGQDRGRKPWARRGGGRHPLRL